MKLSIIIPTLNEARLIGRLLDRLLTEPAEQLDIIVVDGGSKDETLKIVQSYPVRIFKSAPSRAKQMNLGVEKAKFENLYFVHADTLPPLNYLEDWKELDSHPAIKAACYRSKFECDKRVLKINEYFTRFYWLAVRGGDQSLFISKTYFQDLKGFNPTHEIMEEYPLIEKMLADKTLKIIPKTILISTRKYDSRSWFKVNRANFVAFQMFRNGASNKKIKERYKQLLSD